MHNKKVSSWPFVDFSGYLGVPASPSPPTPSISNIYLYRYNTEPRQGALFSLEFTACANYPAVRSIETDF